MRGFFAASTVALLVLPHALVAQEDALRTQIRADLMQDPRAAQMSSVEFDALVDALAMQAEEEGTASEYLGSQNTFDYSSLFDAEDESGTIFTPMFVALLALAAILLAVAIYIIRNRGRRLDEPSDVSA